MWIFFSFLFVVLPLWVIFTKFGEKGWYATIPIYRSYVLAKIAGAKLLLLEGALSPILLQRLCSKFGFTTSYAVVLSWFPTVFAVILLFIVSEFQFYRYFPDFQGINSSMVDMIFPVAPWFIFFIILAIPIQVIAYCGTPKIVTGKDR
jgi:hypothetical protein